MLGRIGDRGEGAPLTIQGVPYRTASRPTAPRARGIGCAASVIGIFYGRLTWRFHRYAILASTFALFGIGYCSLGLATTLPLVAFAVICIGLGNGILMPTILIWIAAITPKQFLGRASGGFSVALNTGQFASTLAIVPVIAITATHSNMFLAFGCIALLLALPYALATVRVKGTVALPETVKTENRI